MAFKNVILRREIQFYLYCCNDPYSRFFASKATSLSLSLNNNYYYHTELLSLSAIDGDVVHICVDLLEAVYTLLWASDTAGIEELVDVRKQLVIK